MARRPKESKSVLLAGTNIYIYIYTNYIGMKSILPFESLVLGSSIGNEGLRPYDSRVGRTVAEGRVK